MPTNYEIHKALNQLSTLVVGRDRAIETNHLETDPVARIQKLKELVDEDFRQSVALEDTKNLKQIERTMSSLQSLMVLAELADSALQ